MKLECVKDKLKTAISKVDKITGKNLTLPILSCILFEAKNNTLTLKATNLDIGIEITVPAKIEEEGIVAVPGITFSNFLSNLYTEKNIILETKEGNLIVSTQHNTTVIKTFPPEDFPSIPTVIPERSFTITSRELTKSLKSVWYSAAISSMKPEISSVYLYTEEDSLVCVATDSFRLAEKKIKNKKVRDFGSLLIPVKNIAEIIKVFEEASAEIEVSVDKNQASFSAEGVYLVSRIIEGTFPDYRQILPKESKTEVVLLKQDLINALKLSNVFTDKFNQLAIHIDPKNKSLILTTKNGDVGENKHNIEASVSGESLDITFNYKYIADSFQSIDADSIVLKFNGANRPLTISPVSDPSFIYLVMPMNR